MRLDLRVGQRIVYDEQEKLLQQYERVTYMS